MYRKDSHGSERAGAAQAPQEGSAKGRPAKASLWPQFRLSFSAGGGRPEHTGGHPFFSNYKSDKMLGSRRGDREVGWEVKEQSPSQISKTSKLTHSHSLVHACYV